MLTRAKYVRRPWSGAELAKLRREYPNRPTQQIADELGRTLTMTYQTAMRNGLKKSAEYLASPHACRLRRGDKVGWAHRFQAGHVPANKGLRRPGWAAGRMRETQFKQGERRGVAATNYQPIGTVRKDPEGYLRIKIRDAQPGEHTGFGNTRLWPLLNRHIWEKHKGPIPPNHAVCFLNGDRSNCDISNLELVSRKELMARNTVHRLPKELALTIQLKGALRRKIRTLDGRNQEQNQRFA